MTSSLLKIPDNTISFFREIYEDLAKPGISQLGKAFGILIGFIPASFWKLEFYQKQREIMLTKRLEQFRKGLEAIPIQEVVPIVPDLGIPILEKLAYVQTNEIADLFIQLLTANATQKKAISCHPRMIRTIESFSPDEAKIIKYLGSLDDSTYILPALKMSFDYDDAIIEIFNKYHNFEVAIDLDNPSAVLIYIDNLIALGILECQDYVTAGPPSYEELEKTKFVVDQKIEYLQQYETEGRENFSFSKRSLLITNFGRLFINTCTK